jgi:hypothetical protein
MWVSGCPRSAAWNALLALRSSAGVLALSLVVAFCTGRAAAQPNQKSSIEGHVLAIDEGGIVVDLAGARGASDGDVVELWRPLKLRHPVTGKPVVDRFLIGRLKLTQVRDRLALAKLDGKPLRAVEVGDVVVLEREQEARAEVEPPAKPATMPPASADARMNVPKAATGEPKASDAEAEAVSKLFESLRGADVRTRVLAYENHVRAQPNGRFAVVLYEEAAQLRRLLRLEKAGGELEPVRLSSFAEPKSALAGVPLTIGIELGGDASGAVLHSRRDGEVAYVSTPMPTAGTGYYAVTVPGSRMQARGFHYFIEATNSAGEAVPVVASAAQPNRVTVHDIPKPTPPPRHESTISALTDYADWNNLKGNDVVWQTEGYFGMRFRDVGLRAARTGFGVYRGVGGSLVELDELELSARKVGLTYGYLEGEFGTSEQFALIGRAVVGLQDDGLGTGAQALARIGNDKKTNLLLGGEALGGIGLRSITQLELAVIDRVPILLRTEVTNQPAGDSAGADARPDDPILARRGTSRRRGELGARAIVQVGYRFVPELTLAVRGSYQGRTINHAGPGFGGAVTYTW